MIAAVVETVPMTPRRGRPLLAAEAAALAGISVSQWHGWRARGVPKNNPIPAPDAPPIDGRTPRWYEQTVRDWMARRPGSPGHAREESP